MNKIIPHLWFDKEAVEAANFYVSLFSETFGGQESKIKSVVTIHDTPSGDADTVSFTLAGQPFMAISAGPLFKFNPSVSFFVNFDPSRDLKAREHLDAMWKQLSEGGIALMELGEYPFSKHYGWIQDRYGVSWQLILTDPAGEERPVIVPSLLFVGPNAGRAKEAIDFYVSVFKDSKMGTFFPYGPGQEPDREGTVAYADFQLLGQWLAGMDSAREHKFAFNEAISLMVECNSQEEIDYYWEKLSAVPEAEQCGWLKDKFGLSWQISPKVLGKLMAGGDTGKTNRVTQAFLKMKKFDIAELERAAEGK